MTKIALLLAIALLVGCSDEPVPVAQAEDVYASIRRAELERERARPGSGEKTRDGTSKGGAGKSQL